MRLLGYLSLGLLMASLIAPRTASAANPTLSDAMTQLESVADGYPPRLDGKGREDVVKLWKWVEGGLLQYRASRPTPDENAEYLLAETYRLGHNLDIPGASDKAIEHFKAAIAINPANSKTHSLYGRHLTFINDMADGEKELLLGIALDPRGTSDRALYDLAYNFYFQKRFALAASFADRYLRVKPDDAPMKMISDVSKKVLAGGEPPKTLTIQHP